MLHRTSAPAPVPIPADIMRLRADNAENDDVNSEAIWRKYITMSEDKWTILSKTDLVIRAEEAKTMGLVNEIADFKLPEATQLFNIS